MEEPAMPVDIMRTPRSYVECSTKTLVTVALATAAFLAASLASSLTPSWAASLAPSAEASPAASAEELRPFEAKSLHLGDLHGVVYYTEQGGGYRVVATLAGQGGTPIRFESTLLPEQKVVVSIPGWAGAKDWTIEFLRRDDRLVVETN
jgi:hypothetical protein